MIASPRSLARKPLALGVLIFVCFVAGVMGFLYLMEGSESARTVALEERAEEMEAERVAQKMADYVPAPPLCDADVPDLSEGEERWVDYLDCLAERKRDPRERLEGVNDGLEKWASDELRERRWRLLRELGRHDELVRHLRSELEAEGLDEARRNRGELHLVDALMNQDSRPWSERRAEVTELLATVDAGRCDELATVIYSAHAVEDASRVGEALRAYDARGCAARVHSGKLDVLMELVGVGTVANLYDESPERVVAAPTAVATNFKIKSEFAMCAAELPGEARMREACEAHLRAIAKQSVVWLR